VGLRIGEVDLSVDAQTDGLRRAVRDIQALSAAVDKAARSKAKGSQAIANALAQQERAVKRAFQQTLALQQAQRNAGAPVLQIGATTRALQSMTRELSSGKAGSIDLGRSIDAVTAKLNRQERALKQMQAAQREQAQLARVAAQEASALERQRNASSRAGIAVAGVAAVAATKEGGTSFDSRATALLAAYNAELTRGRLSTEQFGAANRRFAEGMATIKREMQAAASIPGPHKAVGAFTQLANAATLAAGPLSGVGSRLQAVGRIAKDTSLSMVAAVAGSTGLAVAMGALATGTIRTAIEMERVDAMLISVTRSQLAADNAFNVATQTARTYGLDLKTLVKGYGQLIAASQGTSLEGKKTEEIFLAMSKASAALRLSSDQFAGSMLALQQIISKGNVQAEELRGQLGERLYGAFQKAARAMGVNTAALNDMLRKGQVLSEDFIPKFVKVLNQDFSAGATSSLSSLTAQINLLSTAITQFQIEFDQTANISAKFKTILQGLIGIVDSARSNMSGWISTIAGVGGAFIALNIPRIIGGFITLIKWISGATAAMKALNLVVGNTPWGIFLKGIGLATAGIVGFITASEAMKASLKEQDAQYKNLRETFKGYSDASAEQRVILQQDRDVAVRTAALRIKAIDDELAKLRERRKELQSGAANKVAVQTRYGVQYKSRGADEVQKELDANIQRITQLAVQQARLRQDIISTSKLPFGEKPFVPPPPDEDKDGKKKGKVKDLTKAYADYARVINEVLKAQTDIATKQDAMRAFDAGKQDAFEWAEALTQAKEALHGLAPVEIQGISNVLSSMGFSAGSAAEQLAKLYFQQDNINKQISDTKQAAEEAKRLAEERVKVLEDVNYELGSLQGRLGAMQKGQDALESFDRNAARADALRSMDKQLKEVIKDEKERNAILTQYNTLLKETEIESRRIETAQELASTLTDTFQDLVYNIGDAKKSLTDFFDNIHRMLTQKIVFEPLERFMTDYIQQLLAGKGGSGSGAAGGGIGGALQGIFNFGTSLFGAGGGESIVATPPSASFASSIGPPEGFLSGLFASLPGFAQGGDFTVGGLGGIDSQVVAFRATPGEAVSVGSGGGRSVTVNLNYATPPRTPFEAQSAAQQAAQVGQSVRKALARNT
jgi:tape measure domain-containing protein